tara:strand:- start:42 stop:188 length:147 start_codon:yes stop_codon:yes gene_type:complete
MFDDRRQSAQTDCPEERSRKIDYPRDEERRNFVYGKIGPDSSAVDAID